MCDKVLQESQEEVVVSFLPPQLRERGLQAVQRSKVQRHVHDGTPQVGHYQLLILGGGGGGGGATNLIFESSL